MTARRTRLVAIGVVVALLVSGLVLRHAARGDRVEARGPSSTITSATRRSIAGGSTSSTAGGSSTTAPSTTASTASAAVTPTTGVPITVSPTLPPTTAPPPADPFATAAIKLTQVASVDYPIAMAARPGDGTLWIARKSGVVCRLSAGSCVGSQTVASVSTGNEQGLLGLTFNPSGTKLYVSYTNPVGDTRVDELAMSGSTVNLASRVQLFAQAQPESNHNGGNVAFGPDGRLYLGLGDGGGGGDQHGTIGNGQDPSTNLGKILRIDPATKAVQRWISGVRNPWRFSFDRGTSDLWVGDVGQNLWEEVTRLPAGAQQGRNLGWRCLEGTHAYSGCTPSGSYAGPIVEYAHDPGCAVTGGYVYRGASIPKLVGAYLYADFCDGQIRGVTQQRGRVRTPRALGVNPGNVVSFGEALNGDLFVLTPAAIFRIDPA